MYADSVPEGKKLTGRMLKNALQQGRAGVAPLKPGPRSAVTDDLVNVVAMYAQLR